MGPSQVAIRGVLVAWVAFAALMVWARRRPGKSSARLRDHRVLAGIALQGLGFGIAWGWRRGAEVPLIPGGELTQWAVAAAAVAVSAGSVVLAIAAIRTLGKQWSLVAQVIEGHEVVTTGPYAFVRHPIYTAMMGLMVATGIAFSTLLGIGLAVCVYTVGTLLRIRLEERLLKATLGERYERYARDVPAFLPLPWRRRAA